MRRSHPTDFSAAASGQRSAFDVIAGIAAFVGLSLLALGLVEQPATERVAIELALAAPLLGSIGWNVMAKAPRTWCTDNSIKQNLRPMAPDAFGRVLQSTAG